MCTCGFIPVQLGASVHNTFIVTTDGRLRLRVFVHNCCHPESNIHTMQGRNHSSVNLWQIIGQAQPDPMLLVPQAAVWHRSYAARPTGSCLAPVLCCSSYRQLFGTGLMLLVPQAAIWHRSDAARPTGNYLAAV